MVTQRPAADLGLRVEALRESLGVPVQRLAAETNIPYATLTRRLAGDGRLTVVELRRLSAVLNVPTASWFEEAA